MKSFVVAFLVLALSPALHTVTAEEVNPLQKVIQLLSELQAKVIAEGEAQDKQYREYFEYCDDASKENQFAIKTAKAQIEKLNAEIAKQGSDIDALGTKIAELAGRTATNEADLKAATEIREKEHADFAANEAELTDGIDTLQRAIKILAKHVSMLQQKGNQEKLDALAQSFTALIDAAALSLHDKKKLQSLLQSEQTSGSDDEFGELGAPAPTVYKGHSKGIVEVLEDMLDKAEDELSQARKEELTAKHNFEMLKQSLEDEMKFDGEEKAAAEKAKAEAEEAKATAEGDLEATSKDLAEAEKLLKDIGMQCMNAAAAHEQSQKSRAEELKALAEAKKVIQDMTGAAESRSYSFLQIGSQAHTTIRNRAELVGFEAVNVIKKLAQTQRSPLLAQLASRMEMAIRNGDRSGDDPFAKIKGLIRDMIEKLLKEAAEEASHKAWCDEEMSETKAKKEKLTGIVEDLTTKIEKASADIARLGNEIATLQEELAALAKLQAEMDKNRADEHEEFKAVKADLEQGLEGVRRALKVLREYYAKGGEGEESFMQSKDWAFMQQKQPEPPATHAKAEGSASGIIGILEVIESDFSRNLAESTVNEENAQELYDKTTQENKVTTATKQQDVKYKSKERTGLEKFVTETKSDLEGTQSELDAVLEYYDKIKDQCIAKPETYEERKRRREAEIAGLKEALSILEGEGVFLQESTRHTLLRGIRVHAN